MQCSLCQSAEAVYADPTSRVVYCARCFLSYVYKKVAKTIRQYKLITPGDRVLIAVSGGKDSVVLADILGRLSKTLRGISLYAVTVDEGVQVKEGDYRRDALRSAADVLKKYSIPHRLVTFKELFRGTLTDYVNTQVYRGSACSVCGVFRRKAINIVANEIKATKIATGHNKDDEAQTILMNILRGDLERLMRLRNETEGFVPRIKPLRRISEMELAMYAYLKGYSFQSTECPYSSDTIRDMVRDILERVSEHVNGVYDALLNFEDRLTTLRSYEQVPKLNKCKMCGEPTSSKTSICKPCEYNLRFIQQAFK
jgi:uncharacterized protein (TIGR00269 family)